MSFLMVIIVIIVSIPYNSILFQIVRREQFGGSHPKQSLHSISSISSIIVLFVTLIWGSSRRRTSNSFNTMLSPSWQVLWHCLILLLFFVLKVSPALDLVTLSKK
jgi:hypothetical protein